jgi:hypothetical protein
MAIINKTGITNGGTIQAEHVTRVIDALSGVSTDTLLITGSMTGSLRGTLTGTASFATSASRAVSSSFAATASYALNAIGSGTEYMTLRLSSGPILGVTSGSAIYIGINSTASENGQNGAFLPFDCTIVSASVYINVPTTTDTLLEQVKLYYDVSGTPSDIANFLDLDPKTLLFDGNSTSVAYDATSPRFINVG